MIYLQYAFLAVVNFVMTFFVAYPFAPLMVLFTTEKLWWCDNHSYQALAPVLPSWLNWFMTPDNSLHGDATFQKLNPPSYWSAVKWLWRNPAYSVGLRYLTNPYYTVVKGDKTIKDNDNAKAGWCFVRANGLFQFTYVAPTGNGKCIVGNLGWNIRALVDDNVPVKPDPYQATFAFTPFRRSGFR